MHGTTNLKLNTTFLSTSNLTVTQFLIMQPGHL